jgi:hypothetical protein
MLENYDEYLVFTFNDNGFFSMSDDTDTESGEYNIKNKIIEISNYGIFAFKMEVVSLSSTELRVYLYDSDEEYIEVIFVKI